MACTTPPSPPPPPEDAFPLSSLLLFFAKGEPKLGLALLDEGDGLAAALGFCLGMAASVAWLFDGRAGEADLGLAGAKPLAESAGDPLLEPALSSFFLEGVPDVATAVLEFFSLSSRPI